jgi:surfeit locus 1 family protein
VSRRGTLILGWALTVLVAAGFVRLGVWQLARMHEKQAMLDAVQHSLRERSAHPLSLAGAAARAKAYDWAVGTGRFTDAPALLLDNQGRDDRAGVRAYRVFQPDAPGAAALLVELGWLALPGDRKLPAIARPDGEVRVQGLLAPPPSHGLLAAIATPQDGAVLTTGLDAPNLRALLRAPDLAPRVLKLDPALKFGYARDLDILPNTLPPERHRGYAVQWFALAGAVLITALVLTLRKPSKKKTATP